MIFFQCRVVRAPEKRQRSLWGTCQEGWSGEPDEEEDSQGGAFLSDLLPLSPTPLLVMLVPLR